MDKEKLNAKIELFWDWYELNQPLLEAVVETNGHPKTEEIIQSLDQHILAMGKIKWEIGTPQIGQFSFTLSPNNDREILKITQTIIAKAPQTHGWNFYHAAPATGNLQLQVYDHNMDVQDIDANSWRAIIQPSPEGRYELTLVTSNIEYLDEDTQLVAADLILTALLGEEQKINRLAGLELVFDLDKNDENKSFSIHNLADNLQA